MKGSLYSTATPTVSDSVLGVQATGPNTKRYLLSDLITLFLNNIPAAEGSFGFVSSGGVWSGDAYASTRAASMTACRVKVNTTFLSIAAVTARVFTASKDTYVDVLDNLDGTGTLVYTEVSNNAASPALASNSIRLAIIVTGASNIASVGSVNQGQEDKVLPIASSIAYSTTDSLGNLIYPSDPTRQLLGLKQILSNVANASGTTGQATGLSAPIIIPPGPGRKVSIELNASAVYSAASGGQIRLTAWDGAVVSGSLIGTSIIGGTGGTGLVIMGGVPIKITKTLAAGSHTINLGLKTASAGTATIEAGTPSDTSNVQPAQLIVRMAA